MSVGLETRTKVTDRIPCKELPCRLQATGGGSLKAAHWRALQPGHYGREGRAMSRGATLKSVAACHFRRFPTPGCRSATGNGLGKPT